MAFAVARRSPPDRRRGHGLYAAGGRPWVTDARTGKPAQDREPPAFHLLGRGGSAVPKSAVVCLPTVAFLGNRRKIVDLAVLATAALSLYTLLLQDSADVLVKNYIGARYSSSGAAIRVSMSLLPQSIIFLYRRRFGFSEV